MQIMLIGPTSVGKTSVLATMYHLFNKAMAGYEIRLTNAGNRMRGSLTNKISELKHVLANGTTELNVTQGTRNATTFNFSLERPPLMVLGVPQARTPVPIEFFDFPGGYLTGGMDSETDAVRQAVNNSIVFVVVIDAAAMMHNNGEYHDQINSPDTVIDFLYSRISAAPVDRFLVVFVPVKSETYIADTNAQLEMIAAIEDYYSPIISVAKRKQTAVVIAPAVTLNARVSLSHVEDNDVGETKFTFQKPANSVWEPAYADYVLYYILSFLLKHFRDNLQPKLKREKAKKSLEEIRIQRASGNFFKSVLAWFKETVEPVRHGVGDTLLKLFGEDDDLERLMADVVEKLPTDPPFKIICGHSLLK